MRGRPKPEHSSLPEGLGQQMATAMMTMMEGLEPLFEAANGLRTRLEGEGWSPTAAEVIAMDLVRATLETISKNRG